MTEGVRLKLDSVIRRIGEASYQLRVGTKVLIEGQRRPFSESEVRHFREEENEKRNLVVPDNFFQAVRFAEDKMQREWGNILGKNPFFPETRVFVFRRDSDTNLLMRFKDHVRGIDTIKSSETIKLRNIAKRHEGTEGSYFRGIICLNEIDPTKSRTAYEEARRALAKAGLSADVKEQDIGALIYSTMLVHEKIHGLDKFFSKPQYSSFSEPAAHLLEYITMTRDMSESQRILYNAVLERYFDRGNSVEYDMKKSQRWVDQMGGVSKLKDILLSGTAGFQERLFFKKSLMGR